MTRNAFLASDGLLKCHGYIDANETGDVKLPVEDSFDLSPRKWKWSGDSWAAVSGVQVFSVSSARKNRIRNSQWRYTPGNKSFTSPAPGTGLFFLDPVPRRWWHGPGTGASTSADFLQAVSGEWDGNPEQFLRIEWLSPPTQGDPHYFPTFRNTVLEHWINRARMLAGKMVTLSWQMRSPGSVPIGLVIWRSYTNHPLELWPGPTFVLTPGIVQRVDFTLSLPLIPLGYDVDPYSFLGVGVDLIGATGPTIDFGPCQFNEGGPQPIEEIQYEEEKLMAIQPYP